MQASEILNESLMAVASWWRRAREDMNSFDELAHFSPQELEALAADCGISVDQFTRIVHLGPHAADELNAMLDALDLDMGDFDRTAQREMTVACAECGSKGTCRRSLQKGTAADEFEDFCANAERLKLAVAG